MMKSVYKGVALVVVLCIAGSVGALLMGFLFERQLHETKERYTQECPMRLEELKGFMETWASGAGGAYPSDLAPVVQAFEKMTPERRRARLHPLLCPESEQDVLEGNIDASKSDYVYLNWQAQLTNGAVVSGDYPMLYDKRLSNHGGRGIYVMKVNGTIIWDAGARWLQSFAASNLSNKIRLPE
ncbi:MAG: hypothetical protein NT154_01505 [Verrucomicrobia bacterium]|nr:hypothetical protein [Verrucomicrobiota bacterium]